MKLRLILPCLLCAMLVVVAAIAFAQPQRSTKRPATQARTRAEITSPESSAKAKALVKQMSDYLKGLPRFSFRGEVNQEVILPSGSQLDLVSNGEIFVERPNKLRVNVTSANRERQFFYNGTTVALYSPREKMYATANVTGTIDQMLDTITQRFGLAFPTTDFLRTDPYKTLMANVQASYFIGPSIINGAYSNQLAFRQKEIDWQLWIEADNTPVPRRLIITDKVVTGKPRYMVTMTNWNVQPTFDESIFTFVPPPDAKKIRILEMPRQQGAVGRRTRK